jgi:hypothetical protein
MTGKQLVDRLEVSYKFVVRPAPWRRLLLLKDEEGVNKELSVKLEERVEPMSMHGRWHLVVFGEVQLQLLAKASWRGRPPSATEAVRDAADRDPHREPTTARVYL